EHAMLLLTPLLDEPGTIDEAAFTLLVRIARRRDALGDVVRALRRRAQLALSDEERDDADALLAELTIREGPRVEARPEGAEARADLGRDPRSVPALRALLRGARVRGAADAEWCAAAALAFLGAASEEERALAKKPQEMPRGALDNEAWYRHLMHEEQDLHI